jgi:AbrB family looped-hinge helix DNA binding protein
MRVTAKGQVTIPVRIRQQAGLLPNTEVDFAYDGRGVVRLSRATKKSKKASRGKQLVEHLKRHGGDIKMTTDEIMALTRGDPS